MKPRQFHDYEDLFAMPGLGSAFRMHAKELYRNGQLVSDLRFAGVHMLAWTFVDTGIGNCTRLKGRIEIDIFDRLDAAAVDGECQSALEAQTCQDSTYGVAPGGEIVKIPRR